MELKKIFGFQSYQTEKRKQILTFKQLEPTRSLAFIKFSVWSINYLIKGSQTLGHKINSKGHEMNNEEEGKYFTVRLGLGTKITRLVFVKDRVLAENTWFCRHDKAGTLSNFWSWCLVKRSYNFIDLPSNLLPFIVISSRCCYIWNATNTYFNIN